MHAETQAADAYQKTGIRSMINLAIADLLCGVVRKTTIKTRLWPPAAQFVGCAGGRP